MSTAQPKSDLPAGDEGLDLALDASVGQSLSRRPIEFVDQTQSLTSATTSLLQSRLEAVSILLIAVFGMVLVWTMFNEGAGALTDVGVYRNASLLRLALLGIVLGVLKSNPTLSRDYLKGIEYALFAGLTLLWVLARYDSLVSTAASGDVLRLMVDGRTSMIGLFLLIIVYGIFIPNSWYDTAKVVLTMSLAPVLTLVVFELRHPDLLRQVQGAISWDYVSMNVLIILVGAVFSTYAAKVLHTLRKEVHEAKRYGQYRLVKKLGSGGMGDVHLAEHMLMKRPCALKLIRPDSSANPKALARFEQEVKTTASLTHPNTIEIYDYGRTEDGTFYYVMEYLPGLGLDEVLDMFGPLPAERVVFLLRQACSALAEAHQAGLIHRDLKPGNLHVSERGGLCDFVKVLDFGLVKVVRESSDAKLTADHAVSGTPLYMSPEQASGEPIDARSDLYALGAIAYHMLTGQPPFVRENPFAVMMAHVKDDVQPISAVHPEIPEDLQQIVLKCLEKSPENRYRDANELEQALADCTSADKWDTFQAAVWWRDVCFGGRDDRDAEQPS